MDVEPVSLISESSLVISSPDECQLAAEEIKSQLEVQASIFQSPPSISEVRSVRYSSQAPVERISSASNILFKTLNSDRNFKVQSTLLTDVTMYDFDYLKGEEISPEWFEYSFRPKTIELSKHHKK